MRKTSHTPAVVEHGGRPSVFAGAWLDLANACGGVNALATTLQVSYPTLYRWAVKKDPIPNAMAMLIGMIAAQKSLKNPAAKN